MQHWMRCKKLGFMILKLDIIMVYNRVECEFLETIWHKMGLNHEMWTIVSYFIIINSVTQKGLNH